MRRGIGILMALTLGWALTAGVSTAAADTHVSLTFDDGNADQMPAVQMLADHGMDGTFYIITNRVGNTADGYMTWDQVQSIFDAGNEIGGHTQNHLHLDTLPPAQQQSEICGGRDALLARGYPQVSFAYPFGDHDATTEGLVQQCGYLSGRRVGGIGDSPLPKADTIPPIDGQWLVRTRGSVDVSDELDEIKAWITDAEAVDAVNGSADVWFTLVFHHLCDPMVTDCGLSSPVEDQYITPQDFEMLLDFLEAREPTTRVETMARVMDPIPPSSQILCNGAPCTSGVYGSPASVTLSATDAGPSTGVSGVQNIRYTTHGSAPTSSSPIYTGPISVGSTTTIRFRAEDNAGNVESPVHSQTIAVATLSVLSRKSLANGTAKLTFLAPGPGTIVAIDASGAGSSAFAAKKRTPRIKRASKAVPQAGRVTLVIRANKAGKRILRRKGKLSVPVRVTFTAVTGASTQQTVKVKLRTS
jgi:peptidoglycan/xylan/chitin deacetylase (PgdA/CDA1 family)